MHGRKLVGNPVEDLRASAELANIGAGMRHGRALILGLVMMLVIGGIGTIGNPIVAATEGSAVEKISKAKLVTSDEPDPVKNSQFEYPWKKNLNVLLLGDSTLASMR